MQLIEYNIDKIIHVDNPKLKEYSPLYYVASIEKMISDNSFDIIISIRGETDLISLLYKRPRADLMC